MQALLSNLPPEENYFLHTVDDRASRVKLFAPHGGCIEPCTGSLVSEIAGTSFDYFIFQGARSKDCYRTLHVTSTHYDEPNCQRMARNADLAIAIHGCESSDNFIEIGGGGGEYVLLLGEHLQHCGYRLVQAPVHRKGESSLNFINLAQRGGVQLELSAGFRMSLYPAFPKHLQRHPTELLRFVHAMRDWIERIEHALP